MNFTKAELANCLSAKMSLTKHDAKELVENFFAVISDSLMQGEEVRITGFGNFNLRDKAARPGRNPRSGESVIINKRRVVTFKVGQKLKEVLSDNN